MRLNASRGDTMSDEKAPELLQNEGGWDRLLRVGIGLALLGLGLSGLIGAPYDAWMRVASIFPFATALLGWCPLYQALGSSTRAEDRKSAGSEFPIHPHLHRPHAR